MKVRLHTFYILALDGSEWSTALRLRTVLPIGQHAAWRTRHNILVKIKDIYLSQVLYWL